MTTHKLYVPLEDVMKILKEEAHHYEEIDGKYGTRPIAIYNCGTRIEMEVQNIDLSVIDEMIKENKESPIDYSMDYRNALRELKQRLYLDK